MKMPDLQEWIRRYGGYRLVPWPEWDRAMAEYQEARRERVRAELAMSEKKADRGGP